MNPFQVPLLGKALKKKSLTFSLVFATAVLGYSAAAAIRGGLLSLGLALPLAWLLPLFLIPLIARFEEKIPLNPKARLAATLLLVLGSLHLAYGLRLYDQHWENRSLELQPVLHPRMENSTFLKKDEEDASPRKRGPRGK